MAHHDVHGRAALVAAALADRVGVECVTVADAAAARSAAAGLPAPVVCAAVDRRSLAALRDVSTTLLLVGPRCEIPSLDGDLVACLDGSVRAETVLPVAASWSGALGLPLWLVSAVSSPEASAMAHRSGDLLQSGYLAGVVSALGGAGAVTGWDVLHGHPPAAVVDHARHSHPALVALNSHGATTAARAPWGRTPGRVVLASPVPVLLTRTSAEPLAPPVPRVRPVPVARRPVPRPAIVPLPVRDGDGLAVAARTFLSPSRLPGPTVRVRPRPSRRRAVVLALLVTGGLVIAAARAPLSYHRLGGSTRPAAELVSVRGVPVDPAAGSILVTVVTAEPVTLAGMLSAWFGGSNDVRHDPDDITATTAQWTARQLMDTAGATATEVALRHVGVDAGTVRVSVTPHGLGGPSAGLAMALELVDLLSPGDLTGGHRVAVSGALAPDGRVEAVGGIRFKAAAARRAGAEVLLVPVGAAREASLYAVGVRVVSVASFADALATLAAL
ncbi:MAG: Lon-like protease [Actinomycetota bacterium]